MPHIIIKMYPGRNEEIKKNLANTVSKTIAEELKISEDAISIGIEEIEKENWNEKVYKPDIVEKPEKIYKKPNY